MSERYPPEDPREWLNRACSDLLLARAKGEGIYFEDLCFHAQQAAEKAIKALLIRHGPAGPPVEGSMKNRITSSFVICGLLVKIG